MRTCPAGLGWLHRQNIPFLPIMSHLAAADGCLHERCLLWLGRGEGGAERQQGETVRIVASESHDSGCTSANQRLHARILKCFVSFWKCAYLSCEGDES